MSDKQTTSPWDPLMATLEHMANSRIADYALPGLDSYLIGGDIGGEDRSYGKVRMFVADRNTHELITPHSHKFSFTCLVLEGYVRNTIWKPVYSASGRPGADYFRRSKLVTLGAGPGEYTKQVIGFGYYDPEVQRYDVGRTYSMDKDEIHSIRFARGTRVLFFEGPTVRDWAHIIEPAREAPGGSEALDTFGVAPWMFGR